MYIYHVIITGWLYNSSSLVDSKQQQQQQHLVFAIKCPRYLPTYNFYKEEMLVEQDKEQKEKSFEDGGEQQIWTKNKNK